jgi:large subunit ribosomal protein L24e
MVKCVFCGNDESFHRGINIIKNDGTVDYYCSNKCRKNAIKLGRDRRKIKWTEAYGIRMEKEAVKKEAAKKKEAEKKEEEKK